MLGRCDPPLVNVAGAVLSACETSKVQHGPDQCFDSKKGPSMTHNGFSLTEVLIALVVLSVGLMGTSQVMFSTMTSNTLNRQHTGATELLQDQMERLQRGGYAALPVGTTTEAYGTIAGQPQYKRITTVADNSPVTNLRTVTVEMRWGSDTHRLVSKTILAQ